MEEKKKGHIWLIILLGVLVLGVAGYFCYDKFLSKDNKPAKKETIKPFEGFEKVWDFNGQKVSDFISEIFDGGYIFRINDWTEDGRNIAIVNNEGKDLTDELIGDLANGDIGVNAEGKYIYISIYSGSDFKKEIILDKNFNLIDKIDYYLVIGYREDGIKVAEKGNDYRIYNVNTKTFVSESYEYIRNIGEKYFRFQNANGVGIMDETGKVVIPASYDKSEQIGTIYYSDSEVDDGVFLLHKNGKAVLVNIKGEETELNKANSCSALDLNDRYVCLNQNDDEVTIDIYDKTDKLVKSLKVNTDNIIVNNCGVDSRYIMVNKNYNKDEGVIKYDYDFLSYLDKDYNMTILNKDLEFEKMDNVLYLLGNPFANSKNEGYLIKANDDKKTCSIVTNNGKILVDSFECDIDEEICGGDHFDQNGIKVTVNGKRDFYDYNGKAIVKGVDKVCNDKDECIISNYDHYETFTGKHEELNKYEPWKTIYNKYLVARDNSLQFANDGLVVDFNGKKYIENFANAWELDNVLVIEHFNDDASKGKSYEFYDLDMKKIDVKQDFYAMDYHNLFLASDGIYKIK